MAQDTINEIYFFANDVLKDAWKLWEILSKGAAEQRNKMFEMLRAKPSPNIWVIDAGSGNGFLSKLLSDKGYAVIGADVSSFRVRDAKKKFSAISFIISDLLHAPFTQKTFHVAFSSNFLHHFQNIRGVIAEIEKVAKVGGEILINEPNGTNLVYRFTEMLKRISPRELMQRTGVDSKNETIHQYNVYVDVLKSLGFKNIKVKFVNAAEQEAKFNSIVAKTYLHTYGIPMGIIMIMRFLFFKSVLKIQNKSLSCGQLIVHAIKTGF
jgi:ubiquinone/menaquinone biosynthesis C-methylase UbiE